MAITAFSSVKDFKDTTAFLARNSGAKLSKLRQQFATLAGFKNTQSYLSHLNEKESPYELNIDLIDMADCSLRQKAKVVISKQGVGLGFEGYETFTESASDAIPVWIEYYEGHPRVSIWSDKGVEDCNTISLIDAKSDNPSEIVVPAEVHTDDYQVEVDFNAVPWLNQASEQEIIDLAECGWRGDYPADAVAQHSVKWYPQIDDVFSHKSGNEDLSGFEVVVDEGLAMAWLKENRNSVFKKIIGEPSVTSGTVNSGTIRGEKISIFSLKDHQQQLADKLFVAINYGEMEVKDTDGWETEESETEFKEIGRTVYLEGEDTPEYESVISSFHIGFSDNGRVVDFASEHGHIEDDRYDAIIQEYLKAID